MAIDAKDVAVGAAAVGGIWLLSARGRAGGEAGTRLIKGGSGGGSGGGKTPGPAGVIPIPTGGGGGPVNLPGSGGPPPVGEEADAAVKRARTAIDAARGAGQATDAVLDTGSGGVDFVADAIGGDAPGAFSTTGGVTGASYEAGQLTGNVADTVADTIGGNEPGAFSTTGGLTGASYDAGQEVRKAIDKAPSAVVGGVPELLSEGPF